ncbi:MAG: hypothetical protein FWH12_09890 [Treponema sp.]|nr:hypothetical protein [Treponema sp.]
MKKSLLRALPLLIILPLMLAACTTGEEDPPSQTSITITGLGAGLKADFPAWDGTNGTVILKLASSTSLDQVARSIITGMSQGDASSTFDLYNPDNFHDWTGGGNFLIEVEVNLNLQGAGVYIYTAGKTIDELGGLAGLESGVNVPRLSISAGGNTTVHFNQFKRVIF